MRAKKVSSSWKITVVTFIQSLMLLTYIGIPVPSTAETYSWTDDAGIMHFTDTPSSIPKKYRGKAAVKQIEESGSWEYLATESGVDYYYDPSRVSYSSRNRYSVLIKESYARAGREEYETLSVVDCGRMLYKPVRTTRIYKEQRSPVEMSGRRGQEWEERDGFTRFTHPYLVLSRIICRENGE
jgi:hypothetical protein